jgi:hypothetical protein
MRKLEKYTWLRITPQTRLRFKRLALLHNRPVLAYMNELLDRLENEFLIKNKDDPLLAKMIELFLIGKHL